MELVKGGKGKDMGNGNGIKNHSGEWAADICNGIEQMFNPIDFFHYFDRYEFAAYADRLMDRLNPGLQDRYNALVDNNPDLHPELDTVAMNMAHARLYTGLICGYLFALKASGVDPKNLQRQADSMIRVIQEGKIENRPS